MTLLLTKPKNFNPKFEVVSCFLQYQNEFLLLLRQNHKNQGNTYGVPAGKIDQWETPLQAMIRELSEETGIILSPEQQQYLTYFKKVYPIHSGYEFIYHMYHLDGEKIFPTKPNLTINPNEHKEYIRITPSQAINKSLVPDLDTCIKLYYDIPLSTNSN